MAKSNIRDYSTSAASNTDIGGIGTLGSNAVGNFDNAFRELMAQLANWNAGTSPIMDTATFCDPADATKMLRFDAGNITTATTRTYTVPDTSGTLALINHAQTWSAVQTFSSPVTIGNATSIIRDVDNSGITIFGGTANSGANIELYGGTHATLSNQAFYDANTHAFRNANGAGTPTVTIGGNSVWHAGNDGDGSGLDADLLDGQHGSYYAALSENETVSGTWTFSNTLTL
ncbi:MAG: hypothetical protein QMD99_13850, partial [Rhizobiaceae bacterium]|nr:hypothetical protein [Rhizobiaceae bacterium]